MSLPSVAEIFGPSLSTVDSDHPMTAWPAPLDEPAFAGVLGDIVTALAPHTEADPAALLVQALAAFGNVIGRGAHCRADGAAHHMNLNIACVGQTSKARKGTSWSNIRRVFAAADPTFLERIESGLSSGEGLIHAVRDPLGDGDQGVSDKRLLVVEEELAHVIRNLAREGNVLSAVIREAWATGTIGTLTKHNRSKATDAHITIIGHITRDELRRYFDATEAGNGFGNRFLWVCVKRSNVLPYGGSLPDSELAVLADELRRAIARARRAGELRHDDGARAVWIREYARLSEGEPGLLGAMTSRAEAQVLRLACLYALSDGDMSFPSYVVTASHLRSALEVWRYCYESARYIFGGSLGDKTADAILSALVAAEDGLTRTEIRDLFGRNRNSNDVSRALAMLEEHGKAKRYQDRSHHGRPSEKWISLLTT